MPQTKTHAEVLSGFTYVPVDPFPVFVTSASGDKVSLSSSMKAGEILSLLPDNAVRMSVEQIDQSGNVAYGPFGAGAQGGQYRVTIDYINADTTSMRLWIKRFSAPEHPGLPWSPGLQTVPASYVRVASAPPDTSGFDGGQESFDYMIDGDYAVVDPFVFSAFGAGNSSDTGLIVTSVRPDDSEISEYAEYNIPVYIGVGLRITANIEVTSGNVDISGLGLLGAHAEANKVSGSLVVQTLGVNGRAIAAALPIQSELNRTTTQNAIVAVGSIKALLYDENTIVSPRVVGLYLPFAADRALLNAIISEISKEPPLWRPSRQFAKEAIAAVSSIDR
ncbi:MAG: hypothetical protein KDA16_00465 [Phycisphaerales bacterium]|nr:hypothetical protein [Phycisphaerales bacterium]